MPRTAWRRTKKNQGPKKQARRTGALERLECRLKAETAEPSKKRMAKEIHILRERLGLAA